jgi:hypothetical protein
MFTALFLGFVGGCAAPFMSKAAEDGYSIMKKALDEQPNVRELQKQAATQIAVLSDKAAGVILVSQKYLTNKIADLAAKRGVPNGKVI